MKIVVVDLEATCDNPTNPVPQEIIEIGAVMIDGKSIIDEFQSFVRPIVHPILTKFCTELTTITQEDVDDAPLFGSVFRSFCDWALDNAKHVMPFASYSRWDFKQMQNECKRSRIDFPFTKHINLPGVAKQNIGSTNQRRIMRHFGLSFVGTRHRGIDDARNYAKTLIEMIKAGWIDDEPR